jgi:hypothetical protein
MGATPVIGPANNAFGESPPRSILPPPTNAWSGNLAGARTAEKVSSVRMCLRPSRDSAIPFRSMFLNCFPEAFAAFMRDNIIHNFRFPSLLNRRNWLSVLLLFATATFFPSGSLASDACRTSNAAKTAGSGQNYSTSFPATERPLSEGGCWINGKTTGVDWADVTTLPGLAFGKELPSQYADPTAVLTGEWAADQEAEAKIRVEKPLSGCCREVELRLRTTIVPHSITGYEILCSVTSTDPYLTVVRWIGPLDNFSYIGRAKVGCADGDVLKAVVVGDTISVYLNSAKVLEAKDRQFLSGGSPGIGFWDTSNDIWRQLGLRKWGAFGFSFFSATDNVRGP